MFNTMFLFTVVAWAIMIAGVAMSVLTEDEESDDTIYYVVI